MSKPVDRIEPDKTYYATINEVLHFGHLRPYSPVDAETGLPFFEAYDARATEANNPDAVGPKFRTPYSAEIHVTIAYKTDCGWYETREKAVTACRERLIDKVNEAQALVNDMNKRLKKADMLVGDNGMRTLYLVEGIRSPQLRAVTRRAVDPVSPWLYESPQEAWAAHLKNERISVEEMRTDLLERDKIVYDLEQWYKTEF